MNDGETAEPADGASYQRDPDIVTTKELAALLNLSVLTIQHLRDRGTISYMDTGGENRYSYAQVKAELAANAERRRQERMARKRQEADTLLANIVAIIDAALSAGDTIGPALVAQQCDIGKRAAKDLFNEAVKVIAERDGLVTRNGIADEHDLEIRKVHTLMQGDDAPEPVLRAGRVYYYRRSDVARLLQEPASPR